MIWILVALFISLLICSNILIINTKTTIISIINLLAILLLGIILQIFAINNFNAQTDWLFKPFIGLELKFNPNINLIEYVYEITGYDLEWFGISDIFLFTITSLTLIFVVLIFVRTQKRSHSLIILGNLSIIFILELIVKIFYKFGAYDFILIGSRIFDIKDLVLFNLISLILLLIIKNKIDNKRRVNK